MELSSSWEKMGQSLHSQTWVLLHDHQLGFWFLTNWSQLMLNEWKERTSLMSLSWGDRYYTLMLLSCLEKFAYSECQLPVYQIRTRYLHGSVLRLKYTYDCEESLKMLIYILKKVKYSYCQYTIKHEQYFPRSTGAWAGSQICTCSKRKFKTLSLSSRNDIKAPFVTRIKACSNQKQSESEFAWFSNSFCKHFVNIHLSAFPSAFKCNHPACSSIGI